MQGCVVRKEENIGMITGGETVLTATLNSMKRLKINSGTMHSKAWTYATTNSHKHRVNV